MTYSFEAMFGDASSLRIVVRSAVGHAADLLGDHAPDDRRRDVVQGEDPQHLLDVLREHGEHHPFLALGHPDLPRREGLLLQRDLLEVDLRAESAAQGHLPDDAREPAAAEVLETVEEPRLRALDARVDERLLEDRVSQLDGAGLPSLDGFLREVDARVRHPVDSVPARPAAAEDEDIPRRPDAVADELGLLREADAGDVHDDVPEIPLVEDDASGDGRDAHAVPVVADARDDAAEQVFRMFRPFRQRIERRVERTEVERVREGDWLRAHREDVPQDPADPGGRAAVRLDGGRMVVALDPQGVRVVRVELHDARVAPVDHPRLLDGEDELFQEDLRRLVAAVFRPRLAEALQLDVRRVAAGGAEIVLDAAHLVNAEGEPHPLRDAGEVRRGGVSQEDVVQREREGPPSEPLAQPFASKTTIVRNTLCLS